MGPPAETDLYRDTWVRYLGYANEIGESFRAIVPISLVWASYGVATTYVTADAIDKGKKAAVGMPGAGSRSRSQRGQLQHLQECGRGCSDPCYCAGDRGQSLLALTHHPMVAREQGAMCRGLGERARGGLAPFEGAGGIPIRHSSDLAASLLCVGCAAQRCQAELCGVFLIGGTTLHTPGQHLPCSVQCPCSPCSLCCTHQAHEYDVGKTTRVAVAVVDTFVWQALASVAIPGFTINRICAASLYLLGTMTHWPLPIRKWTTTAIGLSAIPIIIKPIDKSVDFLMDSSLRKLYGAKEKHPSSS
ncbi:mitochondrial fission process protein 1 isoform X2 [Chelonia mydas]|uniref:mitochondrial fission process protein 1 isoform X2 n=1 Tax=Chelonia mydas TaxID=8469 RepID=UPI0018A1BD6F|nr:mitochondrial fission process protein 1 isoform X2 [Chelonia mydas]